MTLGTFVKTVRTGPHQIMMKKGLNQLAVNYAMNVKLRKKVVTVHNG